MQAFINDNEFATKYLLVPQSCYGWDLDKLRQLIQFDLRQTRTDGSSQSQGPPSENSDYLECIVKVLISSKSPAMAARRIRNTKMEALAKLIPWLSAPESPSVASTLILVPALIICLCIAASLHNTKRWTPVPVIAVVVIAVILMIAANIVILSFKLRSGSGSAHETVGVAWALKRWVVLPAEQGVSSEAEIMAKLPQASECVQDGKLWYACIGMSEEQWWEENRGAILNAIRDGHRGVLFLDEVHQPLSNPSEQAMSVPSMNTGGGLRSPGRQAPYDSMPFTRSEDSHHPLSMS
jgi:hypothetical protein